MQDSVKKCNMCDKSPLTKDEIGLCKKILDRKTARFYCMSCLAEYLNVTEDDLLAKVEEFKSEGCTFFE